MKFKLYLTEKYINLLAKDTEQKHQYKDEVYTLLQDAYASIGGIKGNGFTSADDMARSIPFWKLGFVDKRLVAVVMYKFVDGERKLVAIGGTHDTDGKKKLKEILRIEFTRSYAEISDPLLGWLSKIYPKIVKKYRVPVTIAQQITLKEIHPIDRFFYSRKIGGSQLTKMMIGKVPSKYKE